MHGRWLAAQHTDYDSRRSTSLYVLTILAQGQDYPADPKISLSVCRLGARRLFRSVQVTRWDTHFPSAGLTQQMTREWLGGCEEPALILDYIDLLVYLGKEQASGEIGL